MSALFVDRFKFGEVRCVLASAIADLATEPNLFCFRINERTVTQRLSLHLQALIGHDLFVDCEYNRMWEENDMSKVLPWGEEKIWSNDCDGRTVYPDIIVHIRGAKLENLLVIEAKRNYAANEIPEIDRKKLERFTARSGDFQYRWGAFINFVTLREPKAALVTWFREGISMREYDSIPI